MPGAVRHTRPSSTARARSPTRSSPAWSRRPPAISKNIGAQAGDIVGVALGDNADHIVALLAIAWLGAVILPMDVRWTTRREAPDRRPLRRPLRAGARGTRRRFPTSKPLRSTKPGARALRRTTARADFVRSREQPLLLSLSSGTTGSPKGPMVTHGHTLSRLYIYTISLTFNEADRFITATPLYFGGARYMTMAYLFMGATVVHLSGALRAGRAGAGRQRPADHVAVPGADLAAATAGDAETVVAAVARRATADLVRIEPLPGGAAPDHARALSGLLQFLQLVRRRRHLAAASRASGRGLALGRQGRVRRRGPDHRRAAHGRFLPARSGRSAIAAAASPTAIIATRRRARSRSATAGTIRATSEGSTPTAFSISPAAPRT